VVSFGARDEGTLPDARRESDTQVPRRGTCKGVSEGMGFFGGAGLSCHLGPVGRQDALRDGGTRAVAGTHQAVGSI